MPLSDRVSTEEEPIQPRHIGWIITQGETPILDRNGRIQMFGSPTQARQVAQYQGRETRYCTIIIQPGEPERHGSMADNITRTMMARNAARQKNKSPKTPRVVEPIDPEREMKRAMEAAARRHRKRP
jgi:hypothetical protein